MNIALWVLQGLLAFIMLAAGGMKVASPKAKLTANPRMAWANDFSETQIKLIGLAEVLGGIGLIVPWATHILPILTPTAAACLAVIMLGAAATHIKRKEPPAPAVLALLCVGVAVGRFL
jgi:hypothetical protein